MRLQNSIKIDDKEYTIRELTVREIIDVFSKNESEDGSNHTPEEGKIAMAVGQMFGGAGYLTRFLELAMPGTSLTDLVKLAPSELNKIWEVMKETNTYFFDLAQKLDLGETMVAAIKEVLKNFSTYAVSLSKQAMDQEFSNTDTPFL